MYDVENEMTNEDLMKELYKKNLKNASVSEDEFKEKVKIVSERIGNV